MKPPTRIAVTGAAAVRRVVAACPQQPLCRPRLFHYSAPAAATVHPISGTGPPPAPPVPAGVAAAAEEGKGSLADYNPAVVARIAKRRRQAELLKRAQELRTSGAGAKAMVQQGMKSRFWKDVQVREVDGALEVHLDSRPLRDPTHKKIIRLPLSKSQLAYALAVEWDQLESTQQATKQHLIPLTSLVCRALDIRADDAAAAAKSGSASSAGAIREAITTTLLRYLDTDSLLCWAPETRGGLEAEEDGRETLRQVQERTAAPIVAYLTSRVWPGVTLEPVLDDGGLLPRPQAPGVRDVVRGWLLGLSEWDLAGVERATLAGKGLLTAARLVAEWSETDVGAAGGEARSSSSPVVAQNGDGQVEVTTPAAVFGVEEAARATSVEVDWQTGRWGEVEDTHDVEKEDLRRQLGSVVLLVSGDGSGR